MDQSQWSAYYGYGQGYEAYAYGATATQDPSSYAYAAYAGYAQYPQQVSYLILNSVFILFLFLLQGITLLDYSCYISFISRLKVLKTSQLCLYLPWNKGRSCMILLQCLMLISNLSTFFLFKTWETDTWTRTYWILVYFWLILDCFARLNAAYLSIHGSAILGRSLWHRTYSSSLQQA